MFLKATVKDSRLVVNNKRDSDSCASKNESRAIKEIEGVCIPQRADRSFMLLELPCLEPDWRG